MHEASAKDSKGEAPWGTEFPIFIDERLYEVEKRGGGLYKIRGLPEDLKALVKRLQPFNYRQAPHLHQLWALHELSRIDKHRLLHLTYALHGLAEANIEPSPGVAVEETHIREDGPIEDGAELASWRVTKVASPPGAMALVNMKAKITHQIAFKEANPAFGGWNAEDVLDQVGRFVGAVINEFRKVT